MLARQAPLKIQAALRSPNLAPNPMNPVRLLVVDDHKMIINGIRSMLQDVPDIQVVAEANDGDQALATIEQQQGVDVILMDIKMPNMNGIDATQAVVKRYPQTRVLALTMFDDDDYITSMLQAGATGYILKNTGRDELVEAIRRVSLGQPYFSKEVTSAVMSKYMARREGIGGSSRVSTLPPIELTNREIEILKLIALEMTNQEIADKLFISPRTVHSHRRNLMQKIGVKNTAGLVRYAINHQMIEK
jgi:DNA-binding NarL/FixJ family response regulator